jgi:hypothetical protein
MLKLKKRTMMPSRPILDLLTDHGENKLQSQSVKLEVNYSELRPRRSDHELNAGKGQRRIQWLQRNYAEKAGEARSSWWSENEFKKRK